MFQFTLSVVIFVIISRSECTLLTANNNESIPNHNTIQTTDGKLTIILIGSNRVTISGKSSNSEETIVGGTGSAKSQEKKTPQFHTTLPLVKLGDSDNYYYFQTSIHLNFFEAFEFCRKNKMNLLSIESKKEDDLIKNYLLNKFPTVNRVWTSGTDIGREGHHIWLSTGQPLTYTNWLSGHPNNENHSHHCILRMDSVWVDHDCKYVFNFVCETEPI